MNGCGVPAPKTPAASLITNVLWNWSYVALSFFSAVVLSPYIIRKLGPEGYGIWSLVFSVLAYYSLFDLGFRSAMVYFSARYLALGEHRRLNVLASTLTTVSALLALSLVGVSAALSRNAGRFFHVSAGMQSTLSLLLFFVGISLALSLIFNIFGGLLEGAQRFDLINKARIAGFAIRYLGGAAALALGFGLLEMGALAVLSHVVIYLLSVYNARRVFPGLCLSWRSFEWSSLRDAAGYGLYTLLITIAMQVLDSGPQILVGFQLPAAFVGFYALPSNLLRYAAEAVTRIGVVASPRAAALAATEDRPAILRLAVLSNRVAFTLYAPLIVFVVFFGAELLRLWAGPEYGNRSLIVLWTLSAGIGFASAGQNCSAAVLFGMNRVRSYAALVLSEAALSAAGVWWVLPRFGIGGAAAVAGGLMIVFRGIAAPWLLCRDLGCRTAPYFLGIYLRPALTMLPVAALLYWLKRVGWAPANLLHLVIAATLCGLLYYLIAFFTCLDAAQRQLLRNWFRSRN